MFGPYLNPSQVILSQISIKTGYFATPFKTLAFSLFAAQWLQDSSYSNHPSLIGTVEDQQLAFEEWKGQVILTLEAYNIDRERWYASNCWFPR